jgi:NAD(P)-dependent dehydrogenase (short-subunit alcohol dehydrogenase family)
MKLKPIDQQVVFLVGATSGIGRAAALAFGRRGAKVVVSGRGMDELEQLAREIREAGGESLAISGDVESFAQVQDAAAAAALAYGRIDTWVHLAAVSIYAPFEQITPEEFEQVIRVNLVGAAYGAMVALPYLRQAGGGALIEVSSVEAMVALPFQAAYAASKHGMHGMLKAMRLELAHANAPISITEIMPASINTPFYDKARTKLGVKPVGVPPLYEPEVVADAILYAAENPVREVVVGGAGKALILSERLSPELTDWILSQIAFAGQLTDEPKSAAAPDNLERHLPGFDRSRGTFEQIAFDRSAYTWLKTHPEIRTALGLAAAAGLAVLAQRAVR